MTVRFIIIYAIFALGVSGVASAQEGEIQNPSIIEKAETNPAQSSNGASAYKIDKKIPIINASALTWDPHGNLLAISSKLGGSLQIWEVNSVSKRADFIRIVPGFDWVAFLSNSKFIAFSAATPLTRSNTESSSFSIVDLSSKKAFLNVPQPYNDNSHSAPIFVDRFVNSGKYNLAYSVTRDKLGSRLNSYNSDSWKLISTKPLLDKDGKNVFVADIALSEEANAVAIMTVLGDVLLINLINGEQIGQLKVFDKHSGVLSFAQNDSRLIVGEGQGLGNSNSHDDRIKIYNTRTWEQEKIPQDFQVDRLVRKISVSHDGNYIAIIDGRQLKILKIYKDKLTMYIDNIANNEFFSVSFSPKSNVLAAGNRDDVAIISIK